MVLKRFHKIETHSLNNIWFYVKDEKTNFRCSIMTQMISEFEEWDFVVVLFTQKHSSI